MAKARESDEFPLYPGWKIVRKIGSGSFGAVYEIEKESSLKTVAHSALKVICVPETKAEIKAYRDDGYDDASITALFRSRAEDIAAEFALMSKLKGHSNIVSYEDHAVVQHDDDPGYDIFIRMELLTSLPDYISQRFPGGQIPEKTAVKLGVDICQALELCGHYNIIHRDIKPQNIFVNDIGDFKLGDFGTAKTAERTSGGTKIGTYNYMAPEVYNNAPYGHGADIYSLGLVLYWLLNERRMPFVALPPAVPKSSEMDKARLRRFRGDPIPEPAHGSRELKRIVLKACAYDPKDRYASAKEMAADLQRLLIGLQEGTSADDVDSFVNSAPTASALPEETVGMGETGCELTESAFRPSASAPSRTTEEPPAAEEDASLPDTGDETRSVFSKAPIPPVHKEPPAEERQPSAPIEDTAPATDAEEKAPKANKGKKTGILVSAICALLAIAVALGIALGKKKAPIQETVATSVSTPTLQPSPPKPTTTPPATLLPGTYDITVWVSGVAIDLTEKQIEDFNKNNEYGITFNANVNGVSEATSVDQMLMDITAGADIYCFAQDQLARLMQGNALAVLGDEAAKAVSAANDPGVVAAATVGNKMYAYPLTSDNGYFMYYDKTVIPEEDVDSLEKLIADCEATGKHFAFETNTSAWYIASWFFATGCKSEWTTADNGEFISLTDDFKSDKGLIAVKGMKKLVDSKCHVSSSYADEFASGAAIVVTGTWNFEVIQDMLGDHMGVTDLPSFEVDGKEYHLGSFNGGKLMGVKPQSDGNRLLALQVLAEYLTGEACQMERFDALSWGPSNLKAQASDAVQNNPGIAALLKQNQYSHPQGQIHGTWWDVARVIGDDVKAATDEAGLKQALQNYYDKISTMFTMTEE